jgi:N-acetylglucosamine-6-sulfatase
MFLPRVAAWRWVATLATVCLLAAACAGGQPFNPSNGQSGPTSTAAHPSPRPNVVFILTDDLSMNLLPYMPHVQALAQSGVAFNNYFVVDSLCCPSRTAIFTGQYPHNNGVFTNTGADGGYQAFNHFNNPPKSFAVAMHNAGYQTGFMGKYLNGYESAAKVPPGWDTWFGVGNGYPGFNYKANENGTVHSYGHLPRDFMNTVLTGKASQFIRNARAVGKPFALEVATFSPHKPYAPAPEDVGTFPTVRAPHGPTFGHPPTDAPKWLSWMPKLSVSDVQELNRVFRLRVEAVQSVDRMIGHLEQVLAQTQELRNTYFVFSSDNGFHLGEYRMRAGKTTAFDTDIKVPLVIAGPGIPAGRTVTALASSIDLAPTFIQIAGGKPTDTPDGVSLLPLMHGASPPPTWQHAVLIEHHGPPLNSADPDKQGSLSGNPPSYEAIRADDYLYVEYVDGEREYYDLRTDPLETHNLANQLSATRLQSLHRALTALESCHGAPACQSAAGSSVG